MTITLSPQTEALLKEQAGRLGEDAGTLADTLLQSALEEAARDFEETGQAIAEGLADVEAGRTVPFEQILAEWEADKAARRAGGRQQEERAQEPQAVA